MVLQSRQFGENHSQIFGALGNFDASELLNAERISPVVRHRTKIIEPIGVRHRTEISRVLADLLVVAVEITEYRLELAHDLALKRDIHSKHAVGRWMLRAHRHFEQLTIESRTHRCRRPLGWFKGLNRCAQVFLLSSASSPSGKGLR